MIKSFKIFENKQDKLNNELRIGTKKNQLDRVIKSLNNGADINFKSDYGYTPLHTASFNGYIDIVKCLVDHGADIEARTNRQETPLYLSINLNKYDVAKYLIEQGANIEAKQISGYSPISFGKEKFWNKKEIQELLIKQNPFNISILKKHGIPIHPDIKEEYYDLDLGSELGTI